MSNKFLISAAIGFSVYFLYEKYLAQQNKEMLHEKFCKMFCKKKQKEESDENHQTRFVKGSNVEQAASAVVMGTKSGNDSKLNQPEVTNESTKAATELEEPSSIIEQNKMAQNMFDFNKK